MKNTSQCNGCGETILWVTLANGKKHPCNPDEVHWSDFEVGQKLVLCSDEYDDGKVEFVTQGGLDRGVYSGAIGYESHFATCCEADKFRRAK